MEEVKMNVNPLCLPEGEGEVIRPLVLRYVDLDGVPHELSVRAYAGSESDGHSVIDAWQWSANTRDDMEKMGLADAFDEHVVDEASTAVPPPLEDVRKILAKVPVEVLHTGKLPQSSEQPAAVKAAAVSKATLQTLTGQILNTPPLVGPGVSIADAQLLRLQFGRFDVLWRQYRSHIFNLNDIIREEDVQLYKLLDVALDRLQRCYDSARSERQGG